MFTVVPFVSVNYMFVIATTEYTKYTKNKRQVAFRNVHGRAFCACELHVRECNHEIHEIHEK
jgi:hypothetical protein